ncbi:magnesium transporter [Tessaracoccus lubricantis]|uniref:Magnesium transporter MgtE n=1 Tax=Tessaracoccus lubricantis TaxID=545543 RepID=A0ABP9FIG7_9ACTN
MARDDASVVEHGFVRDLTRLIDEHRLDEASALLAAQPDHVLGNELGRLDDVPMAIAFRLLEKDTGIEVFEELDGFDQQRLLESLRDETFHDVVEGMDPDDRARMLQEAPAKVVKGVLAGLSPAERAMTARLLGYPKGSVGRVMTPEVLAVPAHATAAEALGVVRRKGGGAENVYTLAAVDHARHVVGVVELGSLVVAQPEALVKELVEPNAVLVHAAESAEDAARLMRETNAYNLLVVDSEDRLVGMLSVDDALEVIEEADSEDAALQAGSAPWAGHYMSVGVFRLARYRALWLSLLLVAATLTVSVTQAFESTLVQVAQLALFIPMLIGAGGNAGAQAATASVRALAIGELRFADLPRVAWRELRVGVLLGLMLALLGLGVGALFVGPRIALVVAISLVIICAWAATIGGAMPLLARKLRIDPAVVSAPLVTTLVDATGLVIYFLIAKAVLGL